jgi:hypothetical protein
MVLRGVVGERALANSVHLFVAGRYPKTELKEPTKNR